MPESPSSPFADAIAHYRRQREPATEEEWEGFENLKNQFWEGLGRLVDEAVAGLPDPDLEEALLMRLQESCSVYGVRRGGEQEQRTQDRGPVAEPRQRARSEHTGCSRCGGGHSELLCPYWRD